MFGYEEDDIGHAHGYGDPELAAESREKKKREKEETKQRQKIHHIKIRHKDILDELPPSMGEVSQEGDNELAPKDEEQGELSALTGTSGSRGAMLDQAIGAKTGTGSALGGTPPLLGPMGVYHSEPMENAWSELLKNKKEPFTHYGTDGRPFRPIATLLQGDVEPGQAGYIANRGDETGIRIPHIPAKERADFDDEVEAHRQEMYRQGLVDDDEEFALLNSLIDQFYGADKSQYPIEDDYEVQVEPVLEDRSETAQIGSPMDYTPDEIYEMFRNGEPMEVAWSELMKSKKDKGEAPMAAGEIGSAGTTTQRRKEHAKKWAQPKFKVAPGGRRPTTATSRRAKARSRTLAPRHRVHNIKGGLMQSPLAVHMSHLGVQTKQPLRQFPEKYRQYYGQQLRRRLTGDIAQTVAPHGLFGERTQNPGPTGGGRLPGQLPGQAAAAGMPSLRRLARPRVPRLRKPTGFSPMTPPTIPTAPPLPQPAQVGLPSSNIQMSGKVGVGSPLKKNIDILRPGTFAFMHSREIAKLLRELKEKLERHGRMRKGKGTADTSGAGDDKPDAPANGPKQTSKLEGGTESSPDDDARNWGMDPSAIIGSH
tara:strand:- start:208 stop:1989 length:1782 start_codon:yes stop_codon:yes gene_type:complete